MTSSHKFVFSLALSLLCGVICRCSDSVQTGVGDLDTDTDTDTKLVAGTRLPIPARIRVLYYDKKGVKTPKRIEILKLEKLEIEKSKNRQIENFKS